MPTRTYNLSYAGEAFPLTHVDAEKLKKLLGSGPGGIWLWKFTPSGSDEEVSITVGSGIPIVLREATTV